MPGGVCVAPHANKSASRVPTGNRAKGTEDGEKEAEESSRGSAQRPSPVVCLLCHMSDVCQRLRVPLVACTPARILARAPDHDHGPGGCVPMMDAGWCGAVEQARSGRKGKMDEREEAVGDWDGAEDPLSGPAERAAGLLVLLLRACLCLARTCARAKLTQLAPAVVSRRRAWLLLKLCQMRATGLAPSIERGVQSDTLHVHGACNGVDTLYADGVDTLFPDGVGILFSHVLRTRHDMCLRGGTQVVGLVLGVYLATMYRSVPGGDSGELIVGLLPAPPRCVCVCVRVCVCVCVTRGGEGDADLRLGWEGMRHTSDPSDAAQICSGVHNGHRAPAGVPALHDAGVAPTQAARGLPCLAHQPSLGAPCHCLGLVVSTPLSTLSPQVRP